MKLKLLIAALVVGALGAAVAFAAPPPTNPGRGHTTTTKTITTTSGTTVITTVTVAAVTTSTNSHKKPSTTGTGCKPQVTLVVSGTASADGSANITVTGGNHFAKLLFNNNVSASLSIASGPNTQVTVNGNTSNVGSIKKGDHLLETFRVCKADVTGKSTNLASVSSFSTFVSSLHPKKVIDQTQHA